VGAEAGALAGVDGVVEVLGAVAGRRHDDDAERGGVLDGGEVVGPVVDGQVAEGVGGVRRRARPRAHHLQQHDVARAEQVGGALDRARAAPAALGLVGDGADRRVRADAAHPAAVVAGHEHAEHVGAVVAALDVVLGAAVRERGAREILVGEAPGAFDVDDADSLPAPSWPRPCGRRADAVRRIVQVSLVGAQVVARRRRLGERDRRLDVGELDQVVLAQPVREVVCVARVVDVEVAADVGAGASGTAPGQPVRRLARDRRERRLAECAAQAPVVPLDPPAGDRDA
jgi:hypothetical protein